jgi:putative flippase GtrA
MIASRDALPRILRFGIVGLGTNLGLYLMFLLLIIGGVAPVPASAFCYGLGVMGSYLLNRRWTYASRANHGRDLPRFLLAYGVGFVVALIAMVLLVKPLGPALAQIVTIVMAALSTFACLQLLRFGRVEHESPAAGEN